MQEHELAKALIDKLPISPDAKRRMLGIHMLLSRAEKRRADQQQAVSVIGDVLPA